MRKFRRSDDCREDVRSNDLVDGGDGKVTFNYLQQRPVDNTERPETPLEAAGTTDPWGAVELAND